MTVELGAHITTQCYFSVSENGTDEHGNTKRNISRTDVMYSNYIHRRFSDSRSDQLILRPGRS